MYQYQELTPFPCQEGGFGRFMYQYQELTPFPDPISISISDLIFATLESFPDPVSGSLGVALRGNHVVDGRT